MEFSSWDMELVIRLGASIILGGLIGFERELHGKVAGFRTHSLVALGSALVMLVSIHIFDVYGEITSVDPGRIAATCGQRGYAAAIFEPVQHLDDVQIPRVQDQVDGAQCVVRLVPQRAGFRIVRVADQPDAHHRVQNSDQSLDALVGALALRPRNNEKSPAFGAQLSHNQ